MYTSYASSSLSPAKRSPLPLLLAGGAGFVVSKLHSGRTMSRLKKKHAKDQKQLYTQYYNDIYTLQEQLNQYATAAEHYKSMAVQIQESAEMDAMQRDYDEFKQVRGNGGSS